LKLLAVLAVVFITAAIAVFGLIVKEQHDIRSSIQEDALWASYQLDRETMKLVRAIDQAHRHGVGAAIGNISLRFDILYSRMDLLENGAFPTRFKTEKGFADDLGWVAATVESLTPTFDAIASGVIPTLAELYAIESILIDVAEVTERVVTAGNALVAEERVERRAKTQRLYIILGALMLAVTLTMGGAITLLARHVIEVLSSRRRLEIMADDLVRAAEAADAGNRSKSVFLATMSHEIRTPMNGVLGMVDVLMDTELTAEQRSHIDTIRTCGLTLVELLNDVLDVSKLEAGRLEIEETLFDPIALAEAALTIVEPKARERGLTLILAPDIPAGTRYLGDASRIRQVLLNFVSNAVKFTERGTVVVRIARRDDGTAGLRFAVEDTGIGISPEGQMRLFQDFSQVDATITRRFGGTGLGLAISRRLAERLGGSVGVTSAEDEGSTFWFALPLAGADPGACTRPLADRTVFVEARSDRERKAIAACVAHAGGTPVPTQGIANLKITVRTTDPDAMMARVEFIGPGDRVAEAHGHEVLITPSVLADVMAERRGAQAPTPVSDVRPMAGRDILVAEDNRVNQEVAVRLLTRLGHRVTLANNGAEALALVNARPFDLVLMDMQMPVMDGLEATRAIRRSDSRRRAIPILAMTANAFTTDRDACLAAGMDGFLPKPIERTMLRAAIESLMEGGRPAQAQGGRTDGRTGERDIIDMGRVAIMLAEFGPDGMDMLFTTFLEDAAALLSDLSDALGDKDGDAIVRALHTLKGAAANVGFRQIATLAAQVVGPDGEADTSVLSRLVMAVASAEGTARDMLRTLSPEDAKVA
jgi:signal transduction histidine kinase/CheY-like chemotaxis protein